MTGAAQKQSEAESSCLTVRPAQYTTRVMGILQGPHSFFMAVISLFPFDHAPLSTLQHLEPKPCLMERHLLFSMRRMKLVLCLESLDAGQHQSESCKNYMIRFDVAVGCEGLLSDRFFLKDISAV